VALVRAGRGAEELAKEFEPFAATIRSWVKQSQRDAGRRADILSSAEPEELRRLRAREPTAAPGARHPGKG
jgi:transposase-like protein